MDPVGNRLSDTSSLSGVSSGAFSYNADDESLTETYDSNGYTLTTGGKSFSYDAENHLTGKSVSGTTVSIVYDAFGIPSGQSAPKQTAPGCPRAQLAQDSLGNSGQFQKVFGQDDYLA